MKGVGEIGLVVRNRSLELVFVVQKVRKTFANVLRLEYGLSGKKNIEIIDI